MENQQNYIIGIRAVIEALESGKTIEKVLFKQGLEGPQFRSLLDRLRESDIKTQFAPQERLNKISKSNHQGVIAYLSLTKYYTLQELIDNTKKNDVIPFFLILDGISDVRNFGAIARSAECSGASGIILPAKGSANINADSVKTSAGALLRMPVSRVSNVREAIFFLKQNDITIIAATEKAEENIFNSDFKVPVAVIMGSEEKGVSKSALSLSDFQVKIPMKGHLSSLNVSSAASVICFEVVRQRDDL